MRFGAPGRAGAVLVSVAVMIQATPLHATDSQRYANAVTPLLDAAGGKTIGSLQPGAAVDVIGQSGTATHVALHGWSAQGANSVVFAAPDRHIVLLNGFVGHSQAGASQTAGGRIYQTVTIDGWTASAALTDDLQMVWKNAADLYAQKCGSCHALPVANSLTADQWPAIMKTQAPNAGLDANETALLTAYLQVNSVR
jgi:hypothetical protein